MKRNAIAPKQPHSGFTIIEILVATAVTAILVTLMMNITTNILSAWSRSSGSLNANAQARIALDELSRDLQSVVLRRDGNVWLAATVQGDQSGVGDSQMATAAWTPGAGGIGKPGNSDVRTLDLLATRAELTTKNRFLDTRHGQAGMWLRMITIPPDSNSSLNNLSAPRAVSYQIVRRRMGNARVYQLHRSETRPAPSSTTGANATNSTFNVGYNLFMAASGTSYNLSDSTQKNVGNIRTPGTFNGVASDVIANNVIDFGVRFYNSKGERIFPTVASKRGFAATTKSINPGAALPVSPTVSFANMDYGFPASAEIMIRILTDEGARLIQNLEMPPTGITATGAWWDIAEQNSLIFTRRVEIPSRSL